MGLVLFSIAILVLGGAAYLFFMDPFGLFNDEEPARAAAPAVTTPAATPASIPAQAAPAPAPQAATPAPAESAPEFKMPEPAPLTAGEEIAPGVVRLPPDASQTSMPPPAALPEERAYEPPAPKPNPAYTALVNNLNITGIRANTSGGFLMVGTMMHRPGDIVDVQSKLEFVSIDGPVITFRDPHGALYTRRF
ncbi:MAG TPA: hypothetical protein VMM36_10210 [Opitutaceae bacterium]|nr:hypothetical protein [Opitutaceae bacterium]